MLADQPTAPNFLPPRIEVVREGKSTIGAKYHGGVCVFRLCSARRTQKASQPTYASNRSDLCRVPHVSLSPLGCLWQSYGEARGASLGGGQLWIEIKIELAGDGNARNKSEAQRAKTPASVTSCSDCRQCRRRARMRERGFEAVNLSIRNTESTMEDSPAGEVGLLHRSYLQYLSIALRSGQVQLQTSATAPPKACNLQHW